MEKILLHELLEAVGGKLLTAADKGCTASPEMSAEERDVCPDAEDMMSTEILSVVTDSRKIEPGCVFFALCGERFDGHAFVDSAVKSGAAGCVISKEPENLVPGKFYVLVEDTLRALGRLAHYYRMKFDVTVIGITGSVGKTTCREMVSAVLSGRFLVHHTEGNFNNEIGLPMTIFNLSHEHEVMVLEMGMNHPGEISRLTRIASPDIAVITNIGTAHIGLLGSRENIFLAKKEIFEGMSEGSAAILCGDDDFLPKIAEDPALSGKFRIFYAGKGSLCSYRGLDTRIEIGDMVTGSHRALIKTNCRISLPDVHPAVIGGSGISAEISGDLSEKAAEAGQEAVEGGSKVPEDVPKAGENGQKAMESGQETAEGDARDGRQREVELRIAAAGLHLVWPATIAVAVADLLGMTGEEILKGMENFSGQRLRCEKYGDILLFDDTYNASPESMKSSLDLISCLPVRKKAAVLGDMLEQGEFAGRLHREVGAAAAKAGIDTLITIGSLSVDMADEALREGLKDVRVFHDRESAEKAVEEITQPGTVILFKASHSMALDRLAAVSRKKAEAQEEK